MPASTLLQLEKLKITLENDTFIFQIIDAKVGRVDFANSFIHNTITRHLKDDEIENNLNKLYIKKFYFTKSIFLKDFFFSFYIILRIFSR